MSNTELEALVTVTHQDFDWPCAKTTAVIPSPLDADMNIQLYLPRPDPNDCKCDVHRLENKKIRYRQLVDKKRQLRDDLIKVDREMTNLTISMLGSAHDMDETMKSVYKTDYEGKGLPTSCKSLTTAANASVKSPVTPEISDCENAYRDPIKFRYSAIESPTISQPCKKVKA